VRGIVPAILAWIARLRSRPFPTISPRIASRKIAHHVLLTEPYSHFRSDLRARDAANPGFQFLGWRDAWSNRSERARSIRKSDSNLVILLRRLTPAFAQVKLSPVSHLIIESALIRPVLSRCHGQIEVSYARNEKNVRANYGRLPFEISSPESRTTALTLLPPLWKHLVHPN
jgi:hypothetical protein